MRRTAIAVLAVMGFALAANADEPAPFDWGSFICNVEPNGDLEGCLASMREQAAKDAAKPEWQKLKEKQAMDYCFKLPTGGSYNTLMLRRCVARAVNGDEPFDDPDAAPRREAPVIVVPQPAPAPSPIPPPLNCTSRRLPNGNVQTDCF